MKWTYLNTEKVKYTTAFFYYDDFLPISSTILESDIDLVFIINACATTAEREEEAALSFSAFLQ